MYFIILKRSIGDIHDFYSLDPKKDYFLKPGVGMKQLYKFYNLNNSRYGYTNYNWALKTMNNEKKWYEDACKSGFLKNMPKFYIVNDEYFNNIEVKAILNI